jgi:hypothetical protein
MVAAELGLLQSLLASLVALTRIRIHLQLALVVSILPNSDSPSRYWAADLLLQLLEHLHLHYRQFAVP